MVLSEKPHNRANMKSVTFDESKNEVHATFGMHHLTRAEVESVWYSAVDFKMIKKEYTVIVRMMMKAPGKFEETGTCCPRGLEFKTKRGAWQRNRNKQRACEAVLEEQELQKAERCSDPEFMADLYVEMTASCSLEALNRGLNDQKEMISLLDEDVRTARDQRLAPKKAVEVPRRRRSVTETLNGHELIQPKRLITT